MKLQDTYAAETGAAGSWKVIGYIGPGTKDGDKKSTTTAFDYTDEFNPSDTEKGTTMVNSTALTKAVAWQAESKTALNDCKIQSKWQISIESSSQGGVIVYTPKAGCSELTANFEQIGK